MSKARGIKRVINAAKYSLLGFKAAIKHEVAFRQEFILFIFSLVIVLCINFTIYERILLVGSIGVVMVVELINSAIECVVDRISEEKHELSGRAKDYGSAAVFLSIVLTFVLWIYIFTRHFFPE